MWSSRFIVAFFVQNKTCTCKEFRSSSIRFWAASTTTIHMMFLLALVGGLLGIWMKAVLFQVLWKLDSWDAKIFWKMCLVDQKPHPLPFLDGVQVKPDHLLWAEPVKAKAGVAGIFWKQMICPVEYFYF